MRAPGWGTSPTAPVVSPQGRALRALPSGHAHSWAQLRLLPRAQALPAPGLHWVLALGHQEQSLPLQGGSEGGQERQAWWPRTRRGVRGGAPLSSPPRQALPAPAREYGFVPTDRRWQARP